MIHQEFFVLQPSGDNLFNAASRLAMRAYGDAIRNSYPAYAEEITRWADTETGLHIRREQERINAQSRDI